MRKVKCTRHCWADVYISNMELGNFLTWMNSLLLKDGNPWVITWRHKPGCINQIKCGGLGRRSCRGAVLLGFSVFLLFFLYMSNCQGEGGRGKGEREEKGEGGRGRVKEKGMAAAPPLRCARELPNRAAAPFGTVTSTCICHHESGRPFAAKRFYLRLQLFVRSELSFLALKPVSVQQSF